MIACVTIIPTIVLTQSVIGIWIGKGYLLPSSIVWLCCFDLYIHLVHSSLCDFINGSGLFKKEKNIGIAGAVTNLVSSIILAYKIGMLGVLIGTIISQMLFWICRSNLVYKHCFDKVKKGLVKYWFTQFVYGVLFLLVSFIMSKVYQKINMDTFVLRFVIGGICCETLILILHFVVFGKTEEFKQLKNIVLNI